MKKFMDDSFLLTTPAAERLYFDYAEKQPIVDYHCHNSPAEIACDRHFTSITELWLGGDHYKWRAMRLNGIDESLITGDGDPYEKFLAWAATIERCPGNPLYHWTHLELQRCFGINRPLGTGSAAEIYREINSQLGDGGTGVWDLLGRFRVTHLCTTDDPADSLEHHEAIRGSALPTKVLPAFRPDQALAVTAPGFRGYIETLSAASGIEIRSLRDLKDALVRRMERFREMSCRASDMAFTEMPGCYDAAVDPDSVLQKTLSGEEVSPQEAERYQTDLALFLAEEYSRLGWAMELHLGALRDNNAEMLRRLGANTGYDSLHDGAVAVKLSRFLDALERRDVLPKTVLFTLNPKDNYVLGSMLGNFSRGIPGKLQFGTAWWFCDNRDGITEQIKALANTGVLATFIGMLTDSRSFLSYPRHEYFRRILCGILGGWIDAGELPADFTLYGGIVEDICYNNAVRYLELE